MKNSPFWFGGLIIGVLLALIWWFYYQPDKADQVEITPPAVVVSPPEEPGIRHPVETTPDDLQAADQIVDLEGPLPTLQQSDTPVAEILNQLFKETNLDRFFILDHFIERFVVMIDNLTRPQIPKSHRPVKQIPGMFLAQGERESLIIDPANYGRYEPLIRRLSKLNSRQVVAVYKRYYPLFQEAYENLGYPNAYFNDRLIEVIDHLLATPQVPDPIALKQPKALYLFANSELEALSAGRKILIRSGQENAKLVKSILREYRNELTKLP